MSNPTEARCRRCDRVLTSPESIRRGYGRGCQANMNRAAASDIASDYSPAQRDKAVEAIEQGAILRTSRPGMYTAVSSDGSTTYLVHAAACGCPAGIKGRRCYHRLAVAILSARVERAA